MNLQSEGHGISGFATMLSIGLGQDQQFTLILQTLQQLRDVYGKDSEGIDKVIQGNTSNIVFLKSTDDSMIETLSKMSGTTHKARVDSKTITRDMKALMKMSQNEGKTSYTMSTKEEPVISYNDMAFISERNSIVFRAGDSIVWNRNETILPMSWRLFQNTIINPGKKYTLQTIPTLSTAVDFDVRKNQPNFTKMLNKRMEQAYIAEDACKSYQDAYEYTDYDIAQLDPDNYSDEIMDLIYSTLNPEEIKEAMANKTEKNDADDNEGLTEVIDYMFGNQMTREQVANMGTITDNEEQLEANRNAMASTREDSVKRYAGKTIARDDLVSKYGSGVKHNFDACIIRAYKELREKMEQDHQYFTVNADGHLCSKSGTVYIENRMSSDNIEFINEAAKDENSRVFAENDMDNSDAKALGSCVVTDAFIRYLATFPGAWPFIKGEFDDLMYHYIQEDDTD